MTPNVAVATAFLDAMKNKNLSQAPLADGLTYLSPLSGELIRGRSHVTRFLGTYLPVINDIQVIRHIAEGDYIVAVLQVHTTFGLLSLAYVLRVKDDKIAEIQAFYDPRGFLERMGTHGGG